MDISWLSYTDLQNKTLCIGFFTRTYKTKHNTEGPLFLGDREKVSISVLFQKLCLGWKLSSIINRRWGGSGRERGLG